MTTTMAEPEWDEDTRNLVLAHDRVDLCPKCGNPASICQAPENQFAFRGADPIRCHITTARLLKQRGYTEKTNPAVGALLFGVELAGGVTDSA